MEYFKMFTWLKYTFAVGKAVTLCRTVFEVVNGERDSGFKGK